MPVAPWSPPAATPTGGDAMRVTRGGKWKPGRVSDRTTYTTMIPASTADRTRPSRPFSAIVPITEPTAPQAIITGQVAGLLASLRWLHTSHPLATTPGIAITRPSARPR